MITPEVQAKLDAFGSSLQTLGSAALDAVAKLQTDFATLTELLGDGTAQPPPEEPPTDPNPPDDPPTDGDEPPEIPPEVPGGEPAATVIVKAGSTDQQVQAVFDKARPGDAIKFEDGTYDGQWKVTTPDIWIVGSGNTLLRLNKQGENGVLDLQASGISVARLGIQPKPGINGAALITVGRYDATALADLPQRILLQHLTIKGAGKNTVHRGIRFDAGTGSEISDCAITDIFADIEVQGIASWNGGGGWKILRNEISASGECILIGGAEGKIQGHTTSDVLIEGNHLFKPLAWRSAGVMCKNHLELKRANRFTIRGNVCEGNWPGGGQDGFSIVLTMRAERGRCPWLVLQDVTVDSNIVMDSGGGLNILGVDYNSAYRSNALKRAIFRNNLLVADSKYGKGVGVQILTGPEDLTFTGNTIGGSLKHGLLISAPHNFANGRTPEAVTLPIMRLIGHGNIITGDVFGDGCPAGDEPLRIYGRQCDLTGNVFTGGGAPNGNTRKSTSEALAADYSSRLAGYGSSLRKG